MRIAFLSCFDFVRVDNHRVWGQIAAHSPDVLIFLGDNIYMDYGFRSNRKIIQYSDEKFLNDMYMRYRNNWDNPQFKSLIVNTKHNLTTWDDHDFAWNNALGVCDEREVVPRNKKLITRALHLQFREFINHCTLTSPYPDKPSLNTIGKQPDIGIEYFVDLVTDNTPRVRFVMADVRYYRKAKKTVLGNDQNTWLSTTMSQSNDLKILCAGSTLSDGDCWKDYGDYQWLQGQNFKNFIVFSGDIHENKIVKHKSSDGSAFPEFISSGAASPDFLFFGGARERWGLIEVQESDVANLKVRLFKKAKVEHQWPR